jgi:hypothetical protein
VLRNFKSQGLGGFEVEEQFELGGLLTRQVSGLLAAQMRPA